MSIGGIRDMAAQATYEFEDFDVGEEIRHIGQAVLEGSVKRLLRNAFDAFASEGRWSFVLLPALTWEVKEGTQEFWGDEFPVSLSISPQELERALEDDLAKLDLDRGELEQCKGILIEWERAIVRMQVRLKYAMSRLPPDEKDSYHG